MLKMKSSCEECNRALQPEGMAYICSYECTFCASCTEKLNHVCPNCEGELVKRPTRLLNPAQVVAQRSKRWLGLTKKKD